MKKISLILGLILFLFSCQRNVKKTDDIAMQDTSYFDSNYEYVHLIPDSLRTPEQKKFLTDLQSVIVENLKVVDNKIVFNLSEDQFVAKGFPIEYYVLIQKDLINNNKYFKEHNIQNIDSIITESFKEFK